MGEQEQIGEGQGRRPEKLRDMIGSRGLALTLIGMLGWDLCFRKIFLAGVQRRMNQRGVRSEDAKELTPYGAQLRDEKGERGRQKFIFTLTY